MVEVVKGGGGGGRRVGMGHEYDYDMDDGMRCSYHPYRSNQGGICAFCLQEKLGKLVSSSSPVALRVSLSSSPSSSFRSDIGGGGSYGAGTATSSAKFIAENRGGCHDHHQAGRTRVPFLLADKKKKKNPEVDFRRSKSITTPGRGKFVDPYNGEVHIPKNKSWIWSLFDLSSSSSKSHSSKKMDQSLRESSKIASLPTAAIAATSVKQKEKCSESSLGKDSATVEDDDDDDSSNSTQATAASVSSFERKVSRSRSVGCGSRSFSGDFFERISTGFGDCTLRRVESHREGKPKASNAVNRDGDDSQCLKDRVKCGGIFGGFMIHTSSSSSSASSTYWVSSSAEETNGKFPPATVGPNVHGRNKNKGWAFASPMRAFGKPSSTEGKRDNKRETTSDKNPTPNLDAIPSLLAARI